jgi:NitT/TauT family transport system substrate-binding protein
MEFSRDCASCMRKTSRISLLRLSAEENVVSSARIFFGGGLTMLMKIPSRAKQLLNALAKCVPALGLLVVVGPALAQGSGKPPADPLPLTVSHGPILPFTNAIIAARKGFFAEAGLDVRRKVLANSDISRAALASGEVEVVAMSVDTVARAQANGFDWKILYQADIYDTVTADAVLAVRSDLVVNSAKDLENTTIAVTPGTISESSVKSWMTENGADYKKARMIDVPFAQMLGALESKRIDAGHVIEPFLTMGLEKGIIKIVANHLDTVRPRFLISAYVAKASWIEANPEKARRFVEALTNSTRFILEKPAEALPHLAAETRIDPALLSKFFPLHYVISTEIKPAEVQSVIDFLVREKFIEKSFSYEAIVSPLMSISK